MNMERLNAWLGLAGNIAVLLGLIALAVEINGNTKALHVQVMENTAALKQESNLAVAANTDLQALYAKALLSPAELTPSEVWGAVGHFEELMERRLRKYNLLKSGVLSEEQWQSELRSLPYNFGTPFGQLLWSETKDTYDPDFVAVIDEALAKYDDESNDQWLRRFHEKVADLDL